MEGAGPGDDDVRPVDVERAVGAWIVRQTCGSAANLNTDIGESVNRPDNVAVWTRDCQPG
jgi:hypothetical protein